MEKIIEILAVLIGAYLIGSIPTGYIIVKLAKGQDIRTKGSGSTGATNVKRVMGKKWFFITLLLDAFKGALPVVLAKIFATTFTGIGLLPVLAAIAVILGHSKFNISKIHRRKICCLWCRYNFSAKLGCRADYRGNLGCYNLHIKIRFIRFDNCSCDFSTVNVFIPSTGGLHCILCTWSNLYHLPSPLKHSTLN